MADTPLASTGNALRPHSCALCRQRKVRCDKQGSSSCSYCTKHGVPCVPAAAIPSRPRKKRFPEAELLSRLRKYEAALLAYGADLESILGVEDPARTRRPDTDAASSDSPTITEPSTGPKCTDDGAALHMTPLEDDIDSIPRERLFKDDEDEIQDSPMLSAYHEAFYTDDGANALTLLAHPSASVDLPSLHPQPVQIFNLWQMFLDNVHPLTKIFHGPSVQKELLRTASDPSSASPALHALLLTIYANAVTSMGNEACMSVMQEPKSVLISRYTSGARHALLEAGFIGSTDLMVLQAFILYLYAIVRKIHPRSLVCLTGLADRIARASGLHRGTQDKDISPFETEIRRRIWWQIVILDTRAAELSASGTSILASAWSTPLPVNANESDLTPNTDKLPESRKGATDMIFCLVRCEIAEFLRQLRAQRGATVKWNEFSTVLVPLESKLETIRSFEQRLSSTYLKYCDPYIPLHKLTQYYATYATSKMKIVAYRTPSPSDQSPDHAVATARQEGLLTVCIDVIEAYNQCAGDRLLKDFGHFSVSCFPFLAYGHLFFNLQKMSKGALADRAWDVLSACVEEEDGEGPHWLSPVRPIPYDFGNVGVQSAFAKLAITAWEIREALLKEENVQTSPPSVIVQMRRLVAENNTQQTSPNSEATTGTPSIATMQPAALPPTSALDLSKPPNHFSQVNNMDGLRFWGGDVGVAAAAPWDISRVGGSSNLDDEAWQSWMSYEAVWNQMDWEKGFSL